MKVEKNDFYIQKYSSPLGMITLASDGESLTGLWFDGQRHYGTTLSGTIKECALPHSDGSQENPLPVFNETGAWLDAYFNGDKPTFTPRLRFIGTPFSLAVWHILKDIPYGETITYKDFADKIYQETGRHTSPRAVGNAVGRNPISLIVPCHRVIGTNGSLTGYAGGIGIKEQLLRIEKLKD